MTNDYEAAGSIYDIPPRLKANGEPCCVFLDRSGPRISEACDECQDYYLRELAARRDAAPPDGYKVGLAALRAASATPLSTFEQRLKNKRLAAPEAEHATVAAEMAAVPRMTAAEEAELAAFTPPNPYAAGIKALQDKETR